MPYKSYEDWLADYLKNAPGNDAWLLKQGQFGRDALGQKLYSDEVGSSLFQDLLGGKISALEAQGQAAGGGISWTPEQAQFISNMMSQQATEANNQFQEHMSKTSLLNNADQLAQLGLNTAGVLQTGNSSSGVYSNAADVNKANIPMQNKMMDFQRKNMIVKSLLGMVSGMANAGIYGTTFGAAKGAVSKVAGAMANSAGSILKTSQTRSPEPVSESWDELLAQLK